MKPEKVFLPGNQTRILLTILNNFSCFWAIILPLKDMFLFWTQTWKVSPWTTLIKFLLQQTMQRLSSRIQKKRFLTFNIPFPCVCLIIILCTIISTAITIAKTYPQQQNNGKNHYRRTPPTTWCTHIYKNQTLFSYLLKIHTWFNPENSP